jgi:hypothetical protein
MVNRVHYAQKKKKMALPLYTAFQVTANFRTTVGKYKSAYVKFGDSFSTIAGFWSLFNHLPQPSAAFTFPNQMAIDGQHLKAFSIFKCGIEPTWEDPVNAKGGELSCRAKIKPELLDAIWTNVVLAFVGHNLPSVVGVRVVDNSFRHSNVQQSKIELWFGADVRVSDVRQELEAALAHCTEPLPEFEYHSHEFKVQMEKQFRLTTRGKARDRQPANPK